MNVEETVVATANAASEISGSIDAAAETLLLCIVGVGDEGVVTFTTPSGWTNLAIGTGPNVGSGVVLSCAAYYKVNSAAATVNVTVTASEACNGLIMHLIEVSGSDGISNFGSTYASSGESSVTWPSVVIAREGNLSIVTAVIDDTTSAIAPPTGYSAAAETDDSGGLWAMCTYYKAVAKADSYNCTTAASPDVEYFALHMPPTINVRESAMLGIDF